MQDFSDSRIAEQAVRDERSAHDRETTEAVPPKKPRVGRILGIASMSVALAAAVVIGVYRGHENELPSVPTLSFSLPPEQIKGEILTCRGSVDDEFRGFAMDGDGTIYATAMTYSTDGDFTDVRDVTDTDRTAAWVVIDRAGRVAATQIQPFRWYEMVRIRDGEFLIYADGNLRAVDRRGALLWEYQLESESAGIRAVTVANDGGLAVLVSDSDSLFTILRMTAEGALMWSRSYGGSDIFGGTMEDIVFFPDGSIGVIGQVTDQGGASFFRLNQQGDMVVAKDLAGRIYSLIYAQESPDGTLIAVGGHVGGVQSDVVVAKIDSEGEPVWIEVFGGTGSESIHDIAVDSSGRIFLAGETDSLNGEFVQRPAYGVRGKSDAVIAQLSPDGSLVWAQVWAWSDSDRLFAIAESEGRICAAGIKSSESTRFPDAYQSDAMVICVTPV